MESPTSSLSENARKVHEYLLEVQKASKLAIIRDTQLSSEAEYKTVKQELLTQKLVIALPGRFSGLALLTPTKQERTDKSTAKRAAHEKQDIQLTDGIGKEKLNVSPEATKLWNLIPEDGSYVTNLSLRHRLRPLGVSTDDFWKFRKELLVNNLIQIKRGRGGSVARLVFEERKIKLPATLVKDERKLHEELKKWLQKNQVEDDLQDGGQAWAEVTGEPGKWRRSSGHWSRPDVVLVEVWSWEYLQNRDVEVTTYEVKRYSPQMDNSWVFEAASHSKGAHYSYLVVEIPEKERKEEPPEDLSQDLTQFGVGFGWLYLNSETKEYEFEGILEPVRKIPNPRDENELLTHFVSKLKLPEQTAFKHAIR